MTVWVPAYARRKPGACIRLFCFPYAGAGASMYLPWAEPLGATVELWPIQLPGRENRIHEVYPTSIDEIADAIASDFTLPFEGVFVFFGHSLGTLIAYEVAQRLRQLGRNQPTRLLMSAHRAPHIPPSRPPTWHLPDREFEGRLRELNGTPPAVFREPELLALVLPRLRADLRLDETYTHAISHAPLSSPITVFGGTRDDETLPQDLDAWRDVTVSSFELQLLEGDHFFIHSNRSALLTAVKAALRVS